MKGGKKQKGKRGERKRKRKKKCIEHFMHGGLYDDDMVDLVWFGVWSLCECGKCQCPMQIPFDTLIHFIHPIHPLLAFLLSFSPLKTSPSSSRLLNS